MCKLLWLIMSLQRELIYQNKLILQLSEMAADLAEEHSTATLATERLEAEQAERMKLEKDKGDLEVIQIFLFANVCSMFAMQITQKVLF